MRARMAMAALMALAACAPSERALQRQLEAAQADFDAENYTQAMAHAGRLREASKPGSNIEWRARLLEANAAYYVDSERVKALLEKPCPDLPEIETERRILLARTLIGDRDTVRSAALLDGARQDADRSGNERLSLDARMTEARRLLISGHPKDAGRLLLEILARARKASLNGPLSASLANLGLLRLQDARYAEAIPFLEEAIKLTASRRTVVYYNSLNNLGICYAQLGEFDLAIERQLEAISGFEKKNYQRGLIEALGEVGSSHYYRGSLDKSAEYVERAYRLAKPAGGENAARIATNLATLHVERGDWVRAAQLNSEALELKKRKAIPTTVYNTLIAAQIAGGRGHHAEAKGLYGEVLATGGDPSVSWRARQGLAQLAWKAGDAATARAQFEAAIGEVEGSRAELEKADLKLAFFTWLAQFYQLYVDFLVEQGDEAGALAVAESSRAKVLRERTGRGETARLPAAAFQRLAAESKSVILSYWLGQQVSYAWVVTPAAVHMLRLPARAQIAAWVEQYSGVIRNQADPAANRFEAGAKLYEALIAPASRWVAPGARVILVPDQDLHALSFETLPVYGPSKTHFWIEDVELSVTPSLTATLSRPAARGSRLLLIGDPLSTDSRYPRLAHAAREVERVASGFPASLRAIKTGEMATPAGFLTGKPEAATYLHFTSHAIANRQTPLDSAIVLTGGMLYARDLMKLRLNAELVAISACRGAGGRAFAGEGLVGFAWAFLRAGARRVVAGLWDVDDGATAELMGSLYDGLRKGLPPPAALREAKLALLRGKQYSKPYYWGPFQLYAAVR